MLNDISNPAWQKKTSLCLILIPSQLSKPLLNANVKDPDSCIHTCLVTCPRIILIGSLSLKLKASDIGVTYGYQVTS